MNRIATIIALVLAIFAFTTTTASATMLTSSGGGSGGGGIETIPIPEIPEYTSLNIYTRTNYNDVIIQTTMAEVSNWNGTNEARASMQLEIRSTSGLSYRFENASIFPLIEDNGGWSGQAWYSFLILDGPNADTAVEHYVRQHLQLRPPVSPFEADISTYVDARNGWTWNEELQDGVPNQDIYLDIGINVSSATATADYAYSRWEIEHHEWDDTYHLVGNSYFSGHLPEPCTLGLLAIGAIATLARRRRRS